jgi:hypothetical protein
MIRAFGKRFFPGILLKKRTLISWCGRIDAYGKLADFTILSEDLTTIEPLRIQDITVEKTIVGGKCGL